ncbi:MAG: hypothetical protein IT312_05505 [Anaerolineales bacterium]|nr:hypothetical protein [Anaerolineales bacterium]
MTIAEILEKLVSMLEDLEDAKEMKQAKIVQEETLSWDLAKSELHL